MTTRDSHIGSHYQHRLSDQVSANTHQQGALRPTILEPPMLAAVDLHQLANALAAPPRLVDAFALLTIAPQPVSDHPLSQGLAGEQKAMLSGELFGRQRRPEIGIVLTHDPQCHRAHRRCRPPVARPPALLGDQTHRARGAKLFQQPPHLALATPQQLRCGTHRQTTTIDVPQDLKTPQLPIAHAQHRHRCRLPQPAKKPGRLTFLNWTALTFARWAYRQETDIGPYGNSMIGKSLVRSANKIAVMRCSAL